MFILGIWVIHRKLFWKFCARNSPSVQTFLQTHLYHVYKITVLVKHYGGLTPDRSQTPTQPLIHSPLLWGEIVGFIICYGVSLWSVWVSCTGCAHSKLLVHSQPSGLEERKVMTLCKHCSTEFEASVCGIFSLKRKAYQSISQYKYIWRKLTPSQEDLQQTQ